MKSLVVVKSIHHQNTEKIGQAIAHVLEAPLVHPEEVNQDDIKGYDVIGFGSGIYHSRHHDSLLDLVDEMEPVEGIKAVVFSTCGAPAFSVDGGHVSDYLEKAHGPLKDNLISKGFMVVDEFICPGWNTNSFLKLFGGINKGRPNDADIENAEAFARKITQAILKNKVE